MGAGAYPKHSGRVVPLFPVIRATKNNNHFLPDKPELPVGLSLARSEIRISVNWDVSEEPSGRETRIKEASQHLVTHTPCYVRIFVFLQNIESRLKVLLPDDVGAALMDGVVLCHLANHISPRSVASIHVPSPAVVSYTSRPLWEKRERKKTKNKTKM